MNIMTYPTAEVTTKMLAERIKAEVDKNDSYYIALSGGINAPILYRALSESEIDWKKVHIFFAQEYLTGPQKGFHTMLAKAHLFDKTAIAPDHIHEVPLYLEDTKAITEAYSQEIASMVPILEGHPRFNIVLIEMFDDGRALGFYPGDEEHYTNESPYLLKQRPEDGVEVLTLGCEALESVKSIIFYAFGDKLRFVVGNIVNLMAEAKLYPTNYLLSRYPWGYIYADGEAMREKSYAIY